MTVKMSLEEALEGRRSIRRFTPDAVPEEDLLKMVRAASLAPSAGNQQMWRFLLIRNRKVLEEMKQAVLEAVAGMLQWEEAKGLERFVERISTYSTFFVDVPVTIAVLSKAYDNPIDSQLLPRHGLSFGEIYDLRADPGRQSAGAAIQNLLLMAHALGYGTCWMTGPLCANSTLERILKVERPWHLVCLIPVGRPAENPTPRPRKPLEEIYTFID